MAESIRKYVVRLLMAFILLSMTISVYNVLKAVNINTSITLTFTENGTYSGYATVTGVETPFTVNTTFINISINSYNPPGPDLFAIINDTTAGLVIYFNDGNGEIEIYINGTYYGGIGDTSDSWIVYYTNGTIITPSAGVSVISGLDGAVHNITVIPANDNAGGFIIFNVDVAYAVTYNGPHPVYHTIDLGIIVTLIPVAYIVMVMIRIARDMGVTI